MVSKLQAMMTKSNASCKCSRYNTPNGNTVYIKWNKAKKKKKIPLRLSAPTAVKIRNVNFMPIFTTQTVKIQHSFKNNFKINSKVGARANRKGYTRFRFPYKAYYSFPHALVDRFIIIFLDFSLFNPSCVPLSTSQYFFDIDFPLPEPVLKTGFQIQIVQK